MFGLGMGEITLVGGLILLIFGGKKIPELASGLAKGVRNFQYGLKEDSIEKKKEIRDNIK